NWNIDMNQYCCLPPPATNYRLGIWVDTANAVTESNDNNNAALLSGNIQVCASSGIKDMKGNVNAVDLFPNPFSDRGTLSFNLLKEEKVNVTVYDVSGKAVLHPFNGQMSPGSQSIQLNTSELTNGVYFV